jgi:hypothetical protein
MIAEMILHRLINMGLRSLIVITWIMIVTVQLIHFLGHVDGDAVRLNGAVAAVGLVVVLVLLLRLLPRNNSGLNKQNRMY